MLMSISPFVNLFVSCYSCFVPFRSKSDNINWSRASHLSSPEGSIVFTLCSYFTLSHTRTQNLGPDWLEAFLTKN